MRVSVVLRNYMTRNEDLLIITYPLYNNNTHHVSIVSRVSSRVPPLSSAP